MGSGHIVVINSVSPNEYEFQGSEGKQEEKTRATVATVECGCNFNIFGFFHPCIDGTPIANKGCNCNFESPTSLKTIFHGTQSS